MKPTILCDVDGVLVDWFSQFPYFMQSKGICTEKALRQYAKGEWVTLENIIDVSADRAMELMEEFCTSTHMKYLTAMPDAIAVVNELKHKYNFVGITAVSNHPDTIKYRLENLDCWFPGAFSEMHCVGCGGSKQEILMQMDKTFWVDDSPGHVYEGVLARQNSIHLVRDSRPAKGTGHFTAHSWYDILDYINKH